MSDNKMTTPTEAADSVVDQGSTEVQHHDDYGTDPDMQFFVQRTDFTNGVNKWKEVSATSYRSF